MDSFTSWFESRNGTLDSTSMTITEIPGHGRGAIALRDIPEGHTLFTIPRDLTLSTRTSALPSLLGNVEWKRFGLDVGWAGLILCMLWEEAQGPLSKWSGYISVLPSEFDTPMFWSLTELEELKGTAVVDKIGKDDAERDFYDKVIPTVQSRPELFPPKSKHLHYTLENYHLMGSRILSRSFTVSKWTDDLENVEPSGDASANGANGNVDNTGMEVDESPINGAEQEPDSMEESEDEHVEDIDDPSDVAMVPMADMLNARFESENAKLFYEQHNLKMITTKHVKAGEQIWNTYGDPPNSDLLRRYGHVDVVPLCAPLTGEGNPEDVVEVRADLVVSAASNASSEHLQERIDWWLENTDDDTFIIGTDCQLPEDLISFIRLLLQTDMEWEKTKKKSKLPKPSLDAEVFPVAIELLVKRLSEYPTTVQEDESLLNEPSKLTTRKRNAIVVRLGEKYILQGTMNELHKSREALRASEKDKNKRKSSHHSDATTTSKKARR
ncbi:hypothetical protein PHLCEN_2v4201 [Hermanssonia centrifuga]|uniref:Ribosomal lysine N-methyltransferase 4 n=1 Tax=Hermanssonia centrifuga TaxID=98765 RepID=A0A2R6PYX7_9APHY|nr:hypothetical protein PHLCEN_2v4201 [Hermanssonia centrifuga]